MMSRVFLYIPMVDPNQISRTIQTYLRTCMDHKPSLSFIATPFWALSRLYGLNSFDSLIGNLKMIVLWREHTLHNLKPETCKTVSHLLGCFMDRKGLCLLTSGLGPERPGPRGVRGAAALYNRLTMYTHIYIYIYAYIYIYVLMHTWCDLSSDRFISSSSSSCNSLTPLSPLHQSYNTPLMKHSYDILTSLRCTLWNSLTTLPCSSP